MKTQAGHTYRREWQRLATFVHETFPEVRSAHVVDTAMWLLTYLRRLEDSGVLPAITDDGMVVRRVRDEWLVQQMIRKEAHDEKCV